jgi:alpha/beta superfamily hydrolase
MKVERVRFAGSQDYQLEARLNLPDEEQPVAFTLLAHCFTCTKNLKAISNIARALTRGGLAVLRFDFTGLGESEGDFAETDFSSNVGDLLAAADFLEADYEPPRILIGHSLGGAAVIQAARQVPSCTGVVTIAAPSELNRLKRLLISKDEEILEKGEAEIEIGGRSFKIKRQFLDDLERNNMERAIAELGRPLLIFHSSTDQTVSIDNGYEIFRLAQHPRSFVDLDGADHLLTDEGDSEYVGAITVTWARRYCVNTR